MQAGESPRNPVYMKVLSTELSPAKIVVMLMITLAPVAIAILMQNPALRQSLAMKVWKKAENVNVTLGGYFDRAAKQCNLKYELARL